VDILAALKGMFNAEDKLRTKQGITDPSFMSEQMMRLSQYLGAVETELAKLEEDMEIESNRWLHAYLIDEQMSAAMADKHLRIKLAKQKGRVTYLTRIVASGWKQVGVCQSRIRHLETELSTGNRIP